MNLAKAKLFYLKRCNFFVDTNNLVNLEMVEKVINRFDDKTIKRLNEVLNGIKFYVGGNQWHINEKGYLKYPTFEFNFTDRFFLIFLSKIFDLGYNRWINMRYGALRRFIWESFCHELIMSLVHIIKLNLNLAETAKEYFLNDDNDFMQNFISELFSYEENFPLRVNFIAINNSLWNDSIPKLGFLDILYQRKINQLKNSLDRSKLTNFRKIKLFNELRKQKLKYKYEYNFSELVNYCIHNDHFEALFRNNRDLYGKFYKEFYYKGKRLILKFFKDYDIFNELKKYNDSANRTHYFLTHKTFEKVKSACLQTCIAKIKNNYLKEYEKFRIFYSKCPICKQEDVNSINCERFYFSSLYNYFKDILIKKMSEVDSLDELNDDEFYFGIPCEDCYNIVRNIQGKFCELDNVKNFIITYGICPICASKNHVSYLLSFYYNDKRNKLRNYLIQNMKLGKKIKNFNINFGIPCCNCFQKIFGDVPQSLDIGSFY